MISLTGAIPLRVYARVSRVRNFAAAAIVIVFVCLASFSQSNEGRILGTIFDQSGGAIARHLSLRPYERGWWPRHI